MGGAVNVVVSDSEEEKDLNLTPMQAGGVKTNEFGSILTPSPSRTTSITHFPTSVSMKNSVSLPVHQKDPPSTMSLSIGDLPSTAPEGMSPASGLEGQDKTEIFSSSTSKPARRKPKRALNFSGELKTPPIVTEETLVHQTPQKRKARAREDALKDNTPAFLDAGKGKEKEKKGRTTSVSAHAMVASLQFGELLDGDSEGGLKKKRRRTTDNITPIVHTQSDPPENPASLNDAEEEDELALRPAPDSRKKRKKRVAEEEADAVEDVVLVVKRKRKKADLSISHDDRGIVATQQQDGLDEPAEGTQLEEPPVETKRSKSSTKKSFAVPASVEGEEGDFAVEDFTNNADFPVLDNSEDEDWNPKKPNDEDDGYGHGKKRKKPPAKGKETKKKGNQKAGQKEQRKIAKKKREEVPAGEADIDPSNPHIDPTANDTTQDPDDGSASSTSKRFKGKRPVKGAKPQSAEREDIPSLPDPDELSKKKSKRDNRHRIPLSLMMMRTKSYRWRNPDRP
ncbi:hypothetical protein BT69DRAFT_801668 [Atractiella rhizophila]|nr:hypothetical protein BT69DRAFT_801668 [Atractiella rhizophila]